MQMKKPIVLVIMDGVGRGDGGPGDAVKVASTPNPNRQTRMASAMSLFGRIKPHTPAMLTTINTTGEIKPASTAAVPTTRPPMVETD